MFRSRLALFLFLSIAGCASIEDEVLIDPMLNDPMQYGCNDLVVIGRVETLASSLIDDPDDLIGHSVWDLEVKIKRVIRGAERRAVVPAVGFSHAQIREDVDLLIVLSRSRDSGVYRIRTLNVWERGYPLAEKCSDMSASG